MKLTMGGEVLVPDGGSGAPVPEGFGGETGLSEVALPAGGGIGEGLWGGMEGVGWTGGGV